MARGLFLALSPGFTSFSPVSQQLPNPSPNIGQHLPLAPQGFLLMLEGFPLALQGFLLML